MAFGDLQELLGSPRWFATSLLPLFQGALGNSQCRGKLRLRQSTLQPHANNMGFRLNFPSPPSTSLDLTYTIQNFLPHVALGLKLSERLSSKFINHFETPLTIAAE